MRILLLGNISGVLDEGMKNTTYNYFKHLRKKLDVKVKSPKSILKLSDLYDLIKFAPDIIHYTMGPTFKGLLLLRFLKLIFKKAKYVVSAPRPQIKPQQIKYLFGFQPSRVIVQSINHQNYFEGLGYKTTLFPKG